MSSPHLSHLLPWDKLASKYKHHVDKLTLPIGECGKIKLTNKKLKMMVARRKYISKTDICEDDSCQVVGEKIFSRKLLPPQLPNNSSFWEKTRESKFFFEKILNVAQEFATNEWKKYENIDFASKPFPDLTSKILPNGLTLQDAIESSRHDHADEALYETLIEYDEIELLLHLAYLKEIDIHEYSYWINQVGTCTSITEDFLCFYIFSNLVVTLGVQDQPSKWGMFKKECFPPHFHFFDSMRPYLQDDVYMKDANKTHELHKKLFRYFYIFIMLNGKFGGSSSGLIRELKYWG